MCKHVTKIFDAVPGVAGVCIKHIGAKSNGLGQIRIDKFLCGVADVLDNGMRRADGGECGGV